MISIDSYVTRNKNVSWRKLNNEACILGLGKDQVHLLKGVGSYIWELLENSIQVEAIIKKVCEQFDVELQAAQTDILEFINTMRKLDLLEVSRGTQQQP